MLTLVPWLLERPGASLAEAAEAFGVAEARSAGPRPPRLLRAARARRRGPVRGLGGRDRIVVSMADELRRPLRPTPAEALRLVLTVDAVAEVLGDELPALRSAVAKVRDALGVPERVADVLEPSTTRRAEAAARSRAGRRSSCATRAAATRRPNDARSTRGRSTSSDGAWYLQGTTATRATCALPARPGRRRRGHRRARDRPAPTELPRPATSGRTRRPEVVLEVSSAARWLLTR
jgi:proteasome accessory factor C